MKNNLSGMIIACLMVLFCSCSGGKRQDKNNVSAGGESEEGWVLLFDGRSTEGWHLYNKGKTASAWVVTDGELRCTQSADLPHGDLITDKEYRNFELVFEWKITTGGNSGVFINVAEKPENPTTWASGPEYQLLDTAHADFQLNTKKPGVIFGFAAQYNDGVYKPAGEWNQSRIRQENGKVEFYLNDKLTATRDFTTQEWFHLVDQTHFKNFPEFGKHTKGHIALQDWAKGVSFRNIKIKEL